MLKIISIPVFFIRLITVVYTGSAVDEAPVLISPPTVTVILKETKDQLGDKVRIIKIDVDKNPAVAQHFQVQGVPTLILFKKGEIKWRQSGVVTANKLIQLVHQLN